MNLNQLRVFYAVALSGSMTAAAKRLQVSQPAISKQLREFEEALGAALFDRVTRGLMLTQTGELVLQHAGVIFTEEARLEAELAALLGVDSGHLSIGASTTIGNYLVPGLLGQFRRLHPGVELRLEIGNAAYIERLVLENRVDIGLSEGFIQDESLAVSVFDEDEMVLVAAPGDPLLAQVPIPFARLQGLALIAREPGSGTRAVIEAALRGRGVSVEPVMSLGSPEAIKSAVAAGLGVALISRLAVRSDLEIGRLTEVPILGPPIRRKLQLVQLDGKRATPTVGAFLALLAEPRGAHPGAEYRI